ncbi:MAG: transporter substrate-binding domain-containing protein [Pseudomonadota bacterium]
MLALSASAVTASAQTCGDEYTIKEGETLGEIAARTYGDPSKWTVIFYANQDRLGNNASLLVPGAALRLPCIGRPQASQPPVQAAPAPTREAAPAPAAPARTASNNRRVIVSSMLRRIEFLTADGYAPYTGRELEGGGMLTQVLSSALDIIKDDSKGKLQYGISWVNDWSAHLNPLLVSRAFDLGFPWVKPDCTAALNMDKETQFRCQRLFFSEPLYEIITRIFVLKDSPMNSLDPDQLQGRSLCRPNGYSTQMLDAGGRNLLKDGKVTLIRPATIYECFRLLVQGTVDGVAMTEMVGLASAVSLGMKDQIRSIDEPLALDTLHVVVSKTHPFARTMLYYVNAGLQRLKSSGEFERIVERHLQRFWKTQQALPSPAIADAPATSSTPAATASPTAPAPQPAAPAASDSSTTTTGSTPTANPGTSN